LVTLLVSVDAREDLIMADDVIRFSNPLLASIEDEDIVMTFLVRECYGSPKKQEF
jgi:hypothetical protein